MPPPARRRGWVFAAALAVLPAHPRGASAEETQGDSHLKKIINTVTTVVTDVSNLLSGSSTSDKKNNSSTSATSNPVSPATSAVSDPTMQTTAAGSTVLTPRLASPSSPSTGASPPPTTPLSPDASAGPTSPTTAVSPTVSPGASQDPQAQAPSSQGGSLSPKVSAGPISVDPAQPSVTVDPSLSAPPVTSLLPPDSPAPLPPSGGSNPGSSSSRRNNQQNSMYYAPSNAQMEHQIQDARRKLAGAPQTAETAAALRALDQAEADIGRGSLATAEPQNFAPVTDSYNAGRSAGSSPQSWKNPRYNRPASAPTRMAGTAPDARTAAPGAGSIEENALPSVGEHSMVATFHAPTESAAGPMHLAKTPEEELAVSTLALQQDPRDYNALADRAEAKAALGDLDGAQADAEKALALAPRNVKALNQLALVYNLRGLYAQALTLAERALAADAYNAAAHLNRAMALEGLARTRNGSQAASLAQAALEEYRQAAALDSNYKGAYQKALERLGGKPESAAPASAPAPAPPAGPSPRELAWLILGSGVPLGLWLALRRAAPPSPPVPPTATLAPPPFAAMNGLTSMVPTGPLLGGAYRLDKQIGEGGMGVVFEGFDVHLQRKVAIKRLRPELRQNARDVEMFLAEARLVATLKHPNLVEIYAVLQEGGEIYLVFEHVDGKPLDKILDAKRRLSPTETVHLLRGIAAGLDHAHSRKVIHRDLKPSNVMVTNEGLPKVMDFGIAHRAKQTASKATRADAWGTRVYMAPEQEMGSVSRESDLFALGVMTFELLTGGIPFPGPNYLEQKKAMAYHSASRYVPGLPAGIDAVLARALAPSPEKRFHSGAELVGSLEAASTSAPKA